MTRNGSDPSAVYQRPWYSMESDDEAHTLRVALPGVRKSGVQVALDGDLLTITGNRHQAWPKSWKPVFSELNRHDYRLSLRLNLEVAEDRISGEVEDGMLTLKLPVKDEAKPRLIPIN